SQPRAERAHPPVQGADRELELRAAPGDEPGRTPGSERLSVAIKGRQAGSWRRMKLLLFCVLHECAESIVEAVQKYLRPDAEEQESCEPVWEARAAWA